MTSNTKVMKIIKLILFFLVIILLTFFTLKFLPLFKNLSTQDGQIAFKETITNMGIFSPLAIIGLMILQILVAFLPGEPVEVLAGMCFGTFGGVIIILIGSFISSALIFFLVRKFGRDFISTFFNEEKLYKIQNSKFLSNSKRIEMFLFIMFFIPGTPKDLFVYVGGLLNIKPLRFFIISTFARIPSVITSTFAGANLIDGNFKITILTFIITLLISGIGLIIAKKIHSKVI